MQWDTRKAVVFGVLGFLLVVAGLYTLRERNRDAWCATRMAEIESTYRPQIAALTDAFRQGDSWMEEGTRRTEAYANLGAQGLLGVYVAFDAGKRIRYYWFDELDDRGFQSGFASAGTHATLVTGTANIRGRGSVKSLIYTRNVADSSGHTGEVCLVVEQ
jgi:hypothetical protein